MRGKCLQIVLFPFINDKLPSIDNSDLLTLVNDPLRCESPLRTHHFGTESVLCSWYLCEYVCVSNWLCLKQFKRLREQNKNNLSDLGHVISDHEIDRIVISQNQTEKNDFIKTKKKTFRFIEKPAVTSKSMQVSFFLIILFICHFSRNPLVNSAAT